MTLPFLPQRLVAKRIFPLAALAIAALALSGCGTVVIGSITLGQISAAAGVASVGTTGKGLQDHALSAVTGRDCRVLEGIVRRGRRICEEVGSPATENDFRGVLVMLNGTGEETSSSAPEVIYGGSASDFRPSLARAEGRRSLAPQEISPAIELAGEVPGIREWARTRPAPTITVTRLALN